MATNRITRYLQQSKRTLDPKPDPAVPKGFTGLPAQFRSPSQQNTLQSQLYRRAYEQACQQARDNLLALLRSRAELRLDDLVN